MAARPRTVIRSLVKKFAYRVYSDCPRQFRLPVAVVQWRQSVVPPPSHPIHKGKDQIPGSQSQRAQTRTDKQTDLHTKLHPQDPFCFYSMETSNVAVRPRTVISRLVGS